MEKKLWYYTENYGTSIYVGKKTQQITKKLRNFDIQWKNYGNVQKRFLKKKLHFKNFDLLWKNYGTTEKTMVLLKKKPMVLWKKQ